MDKKLLILLIAAVFVALAATPAAAQLARQSGTVTDAEGNPLEGITVTLERTDKSGSGMSKLTAVTDADGLYTFTNMGPGTWKITITEQNYMPFAQIIEISAINRNPDFDITLQPGTPLASKDAREEAKKVIESAQAMVDEGNYDDAIAAYQELAEQYPSVAGQVNLYIGQAYEDKGDMEKAKEMYVKGLEADPNSVIALKKLGDMAVAAYEYEPALEYYSKLLSVKTDEPGLYYTGGEIALSAGNNEKAVEFFSKYIEDGKDTSMLVNAHMNLGFTLSVMGETAEAIKNLEKVLELNPEFPYAGEIQAEIDRLKATQ